MKRTFQILTLIVSTMSSTALFAEEANTSSIQSAEDAVIDRKAEAALLFSGELDTMDIRTDVKNGAVTITGYVDNDVDRKLVKELIASLDGVVSVDNQLSVGMPGDLDGSALTVMSDNYEGL